MPNINYIGNTDTLYILTKLKAVLEGGYVQQEAGKGLSTEDFTTALLTKLNGITDSADAVSWSQTQATGTKIATITINNTDIDVYIPTVIIDDTMSDVSTNAIQNSVVKAYIDNAIGSITEIEFRTVNALPVTGENGVIYLVPNGSSGSNQKDEYVWIASEERFEKIGSTDIDLSGYVQRSELVEVTTADIDTMFTTVFGS